MKKTKLKNYLNIVMLSFGLSLPMWNCQKEEDLALKEVVQEKKIETISFHDFKNAIKQNENFKSISRYFDINQDSKTSLGYSKFSESNLILTNKIIKVEKEEGASYTFQLLKTTEGNEFYNLVVDVDSGGNIQKSVIFKYMPSNSWLADSSQPFSGYVSVYNNDIFSINDITTTQNEAKDGNECYEATWEWECNAGYDHAPNTCTAGGSDLIITVIEVACDGSSGGGDGSFSIDEETPIENNDPNSDPVGNTNPPDGYYEIPVVTSPINPDDSSAIPDILSNFLSLTPQQTNWLIDNSTIAIKIFSFLEQNSAIEAKNLVTEIINSGINETLVTVFPFVKYPPNSNYATLYPKLTEYLKNQLPTIKENQTIINAIKTYTNLTTSQIQEHLQWGKGPTIKIEQLDAAYGKFKKSIDPNSLYLDIDLVNQLENTTPNSNLADAFAFLIGVTVLHEYVHYGDYNYNGDTWQYPQEEGLLFENDVYGQSVWINNAEIILKNN